MFSRSIIFLQTSLKIISLFRNCEIIYIYSVGLKLLSECDFPHENPELLRTQNIFIFYFLTLYFLHTNLHNN